MDYTPLEDDNIVYSDGSYFIVWRDVASDNFLVFDVNTFDFVLSCSIPYVHNWASASDVANDIIEEIQDGLS